MTLGYVEYEDIVPGLMPVDAAGTAKATPWIDLTGSHKVAWLAMFGATTSSAADVVTITVECSSVADSGGEAAVVFMYRKSGAVGTDTWGTLTAATTSGFAPLLSAATGYMYWIEVDPAAMLVTKADARYVRLVTTQTADATALLEAIVAVRQPRYKQATMIPTTSA